MDAIQCSCLKSRELDIPLGSISVFALAKNKLASGVAFSKRVWYQSTAIELCIVGGSIAVLSVPGGVYFCRAAVEERAPVPIAAMGVMLSLACGYGLGVPVGYILIKDMGLANYLRYHPSMAAMAIVAGISITLLSKIK